jgi:hypothetical protein
MRNAMKKTNNQQKAQALQYFCLGLDSLEIEKLTGIAHRTLQRYMSVEKWKEQRAALRDKEEKRIIRRYLRNQNQQSTNEN